MMIRCESTHRPAARDLKYPRDACAEVLRRASEESKAAAAPSLAIGKRVKLSEHDFYRFGIGLVYKTIMRAEGWKMC